MEDVPLVYPDTNTKTDRCLFSYNHNINFKLIEHIHKVMAAGGGGSSGKWGS